MTNFTTTNYLSSGLGSSGRLMKGLLLCVAMVLFQFTQLHAQVNYEATQTSPSNQSTPSVFYGDGLPDGSLSTPMKVSPSFFTKDGVDPIENPDLAANITCTDLRVVLLLDESGSILNRNGVEQVRESTLGLAEVFQGSPATLTVIEFGSQATVVLGPSVVDAAFIANLEDYLYDEYNGQSYDPNSIGINIPCFAKYTNWEDAFLTTIDLDPNLLLFLTDGEPSAYNVTTPEDEINDANDCGFIYGGGQATFETGLQRAIPVANQLKTNGTHIFGIGVGNGVQVNNLKMVSGDENFADNGNIFTDDYSVGSFESLRDDLTAGLNSICGTELAITKFADLDQVCGDETITFTLTVTNTGGNHDFDAVEVVVTDTFPSDYTILGIVDAPIIGAEITGQILTYNVGALAANESVSIEVQVNLSGASLGVYPNTTFANAVNANGVNAEESVEVTDFVTSSTDVIACESFVLDPNDFIFNPDEQEPNEETFDIPGAYTRVIAGTNQAGCPSEVTVYITINEPTFSEEIVEACGSFLWNGTTHYESGEYTFTISGEEGLCDSTATLFLTINEVPSLQEVITSCDAPPLFTDFGEGIYFETGIYPIDIIGENGECDGTITYFINIGVTGDDCNDGDPNTINDTINADCECVGTPGEWDCPEIFANIGDSCDDGDENTTNDMIVEGCGCEGTIVYDCPEIQANIGDDCNDGNPNTIDDMIVEGCGCEGTIVYDCPDIEANIGDPCDDGYLNTINDMIVEGCGCEGTFVYECEADAGSVTFGDGSVNQTFCVDDVPSTFTFAFPNPWNTGLFTRGVITDASGNIIYTTDDQSAAESYDFDNFGTGTFYLYVLNFDDSESNFTELGDILANGGEVNIDDFTGCFDLSNQLVVVGSEPTESTEVVVTCDSYQWNGETYSQSGIYTFVDESGVCPHTFYLDLTIGGDGCNVEGDCNDFSTYYISHGSGIVGSSIYKVNFVGAQAILDFKFSTSYQSHIAIDAQGSLAYMIDEAGTALEAYDLSGNAPAGTLAIAPGLSKITAAVFNPLDGLVYIGDMNLNKIYTLDPNGTGVPVFYANAPVSGGDIAFQNGDLYLATKSFGTKLYKVVQGGSAIPVGSIPVKVNGLAAANNATDFIISNFGSSQMSQISSANGDVQNTFDVILDGEIYALQNGDLASGCGDNNTDIVACFGAEVLEFNQGLLTNGNPIGADRSDATRALGEPDRSNAPGGFVSLGVGGSITIGFAGIVNDAPGNDIKIWETSYKGDICGGAGDERAYIELSNDGVNWLMVDTICLDGEVDMASVGLTSVTHIRVTNAATTTTPDGYDLDGVEALYGCSNNPIIVNGDCYAAEVLEYVEGDKFDGSAINPVQTDANQALGMPERATSGYSYTTLGYGGSITLAFNGAIPNGLGNDIEVVETTYGNYPTCTSYPEYADVFVAFNGSWYFAKTVCKYDGFVDISTAGNFPYVDSVKIVNNNALSTTPDAFDVDGVIALHNCADEPAPKPSAPVSQSELTSYPNPTNGSSNVVFITGETTRTLVEVYDMNGRNVGTLFNQEAQGGKEYTLDFNGSSLPNGVYIYRLTTNNETIIEKFMIAR